MCIDLTNRDRSDNFLDPLIIWAYNVLDFTWHPHRIKNDPGDFQP